MDRALEIYPADYWRYWLIANAPESDDTVFTFEFFANGINKDLADTFGNFVNRCLKFAQSRFDGVVPEGGESGPEEQAMTAALDRRIKRYAENLEGMEFRKASGELRAIWGLGNEYLTRAAPWKVIKEDAGRAAAIVRTGLQLVHLFAVLSSPVIPSTSARVLTALGSDGVLPPWPTGTAEEELARLPAGRSLGELGILFHKISPEEQQDLEAEFGGANEPRTSST